MAKSRYTFEKRQREIARRQKMEEKTARRLEAKTKQMKADTKPETLVNDRINSDTALDPQPPATDRLEGSSEEEISRQ